MNSTNDGYPKKHNFKKLKKKFARKFQDGIDN